MFLLRSQPVICEADHFKWYDYSCSCSDDDDDALADTWSTINASGNDACSRDGSGSSKSVASSSTSMLLVVMITVAVLVRKHLQGLTCALCAAIAIHYSL